MGDSMREALEDAGDNDETEVVEDGTDQQEVFGIGCCEKKLHERLTNS